MTSYKALTTQQNPAGQMMASEHNDLKKLQNKYSSQLSTLKELFTDWSDEDLLFAIKDADGDLELAVDRISEGHANQWDEVKTKKSKKDAQKTTSVSTHQRTERSQPSKSHHDRPKSVRATRGTTRGQAASGSWDKRQEDVTDSKNSWAGKKQDIGISWDASDALAPSDTYTPGSNGWTSTADSWAPSNDNNQIKSEESVAPIPNQHVDASHLASNEPPKTWASLLKSKPKPEPAKEAENNIEPVVTVKDERNKPVKGVYGAIKTDWSSSTKDERNPTLVQDKWNIIPAQDELETKPARDDWNLDTFDDVPEKTPQVESTLPEVEEDAARQSEPLNAGNTRVVEEDVLAESTEKGGGITPKQKAPPGRRLKQDAPVVLPSNGVSLTSVDVKFGSLNLEDSMKESVEKSAALLTSTGPRMEKPSLINDHEAQPPPQPAYLDRYGINTNGSAVADSVSANMQPTDAFMQQASMKQQETQSPVQSMNTQAPQQFAVDPLTSAYSSYQPNQTSTGISGYAMNPDYGIETQRAAVSMGYYDPTLFNHSSPVTTANAYTSRDKYGQAGMNATAGQQAIPQQQTYPYYPYYYMPNHYGAYQQQTNYGQSFMNKNVHPMYAAKSSNTYNSTGSSYQQQQQQQQSYSHLPAYDELASLQHLGLQDYSKQAYGAQSQGFLGSLPGQTQQPLQQREQQLTPPQQVKNDVSQYKQTSPPGPQQHQQQQQTAYMASNSANYFGQQQMFSYQQYPSYHQQQQQQHHHHQQSSQQQHVSPAGRQQQQYWNQ
ncbi:RNAPII degradation factor [Apophysomyces sp. BC1034]|nr:RNAPII degradation factor [Apophysomyces sp. BC1015]KAG0182865.1 RNAPII degradation factor [Apophysomyces sp. BC1021]KAG0193590.1 RNAPII degradation factor [Apophysomyces sp. BC1034]